MKKYLWEIERHDQEDGSISYEIWDRDTHTRIVTLNDSYDNGNAKDLVHIIVDAVNYQEELLDFCGNLYAGIPLSVEDDKNLRRILENFSQPKSAAYGEALMAVETMGKKK